MPDEDKNTERARPDLLRQFIESSSVQTFILVVIIFNAIILGLGTSKTINAMMDGRMADVLGVLDNICLWIFVVEISIKLIVYRHRFVFDGWNDFDFIIVAISLFPNLGNLSILRALRIMRAMRIMSIVPQMRQVVQALLGALPGMTSVIAVLVLIFYVAAVMATRMYGDAQNPDIREWFGTLGRSLYSLFQIMTLESWSHGIVRIVMVEYPWAWAFFVPFIIITSFMVLNLFIALIVTSMQSVYETSLAEEADELEENLAAERRDLMDKISTLTEEIGAMRKELGRIREFPTDRDLEP